MMEIYKEISAIFNPKSQEGLRDEFKAEIGKRLIFMYSWLMDESDPIPNEWALTCKTEDSALYRIWTAESNLSDIEEV